MAKRDSGDENDNASGALIGYNTYSNSLTMRDGALMQERFAKYNRQSVDTDSIFDQDEEYFFDQMNGLQAEVDRHHHPKIRAMRRFLENHITHYIIIILVIVDVLLVVAQLMVEIEAAEIKFDVHLHRDHLNRSKEIANLQQHCSDTGPNSPLGALAVFKHNDSTNEELANATIRLKHLLLGDEIEIERHESEELHDLEVAEHVLHYSSLAIITLFFTEITLKIIAFFPKFFRSKIDVADMILVYISFACDLGITFDADVSLGFGAREASFIAMFLRLWRIARVVGAILNATKTQYMAKIHKLRAKLRAAQRGSHFSLNTLAHGHGKKGLHMKSNFMSEGNFLVPHYSKDGEEPRHEVKAHGHKGHHLLKNRFMSEGDFTIREEDISTPQLPDDADDGDKNDQPIQLKSSRKE